MLENLILAQTVDLMKDPVVASDEQGKIMLTNIAHEKITGWSREEVKGQSKRLLYEVPELNILKNSTTSNRDAILYKKDGSKLSLKVVTSPISLPEQLGETIGQIAIFQCNFSDDQVPATADDFVSTVSHELRTPLTSIKGFSETLIQSIDKLPPEKVKSYLKIIKDQADYLTRLVEDLLFVSRLDDHRIHLVIREVDLLQHINKVCQAMSNQSEGRVFAYDIEEGLPKIQTDSDRLEQILSNLISNAIKYSPDCTTITICAKKHAKKTNYLAISVKDQGVGINNDEQEVIFNRFSRIDNPLTRKKQGTGLGLYITKSLVKALKGEIFLEKSNPKETIFTFSLPYKQNQ